jgi:hypothetical protein
MQLIENENKYGLIKNSSNCHSLSGGAQLSTPRQSYPQSYPQNLWITPRHAARQG